MKKPAKSATPIPLTAAARSTMKTKSTTAPTRFTGFLVNFDLTGSTGRQAEARGLLPDTLDAEVSVREWLLQLLQECARRAELPSQILSRVQDQGDCFCFPTETAAQAHHFAVAVHEHCRRLNVPRQPRHGFFFRCGIAQGEVKFLPDGKAFAATNADLAARLRAAAAPGGTLICPHTWAELPSLLRQEYATETTKVPDAKKPDLAYLAHVWRLGAQPEPPPAPQAPPPPAAKTKPTPPNRPRRPTARGGISIQVNKLIRGQITGEQHTTGDINNTIS